MQALNSAGVRYLVADELAVNAHGYLRFTKDIDLVLQLVPDNVRRALDALTAIGYKPALPVRSEQFADAEQRQRWIREKNLTVFQLWSDAHRETPIDIFVTEPFPFDAEYKQSLVKSLHGKLDVRFVSIPTLIQMKERAGRPQDRNDIEHLRMRQEDNDEAG